MRNQTPESIRSYIQAENAFGVLGDRILEEKTLAWLFEHAALVSPESQESAEIQEPAETQESAESQEE